MRTLNIAFRGITVCHMFDDSSDYDHDKYTFSFLEDLREGNPEADIMDFSGFEGESIDIDKAREFVDEGLIPNGTLDRQGLYCVMLSPSNNMRLVHIFDYMKIDTRIQILDTVFVPQDVVDELYSDYVREHCL